MTLIALRGMAEEGLDPASVRQRLGLGEETAAWLASLPSNVASGELPTLPEHDEAAALLARLGVPRVQVDEAISMLPAVEVDPALRWLLGRCSQQLVQVMGVNGPLLPWPALPASLGLPARYLYVLVFLATFPYVRRYHQQYDIPDDVSWATLADLGRHMAIHQRIYGEGGLSTYNWLTLHFRGVIYALGRLQFHRSRISYDAGTIARLGLSFQRGDPCLGVHIPESGSLSPEACDASFQWAREFFPRHFPEETYKFATCGSWLLDDQLAEYLPATSNIVRFQRRFQLMPGGRPCDGEIVSFVFRRVNARVEDLPQRTTLERAIVRHLCAGRHWQSRWGWVAL
ncbi:MAG: acyltransferase domain-containing protein [Chloroflexi bacterium]|nr:acyltransferase domain-containing protein [Chloroflexota bacterium]